MSLRIKLLLTLTKFGRSPFFKGSYHQYGISLLLIIPRIIRLNAEKSKRETEVLLLFFFSCLLCIALERGLNENGIILNEGCKI